MAGLKRPGRRLATAKPCVRLGRFNKGVAALELGDNVVDRFQNHAFASLKRGYLKHKPPESSTHLGQPLCLGPWNSPN
jgi:hypothetical protein